MKKALYIYNPSSGDQSVPNKLDTVLCKFQEKGILVQPYRLYCGDPENLLRILKEEAFEFVIISGGDGTVNKIVNLILNNDLKLPIGILPTGTCIM